MREKVLRHKSNLFYSWAMMMTRKQVLSFLVVAVMSLPAVCSGQDSTTVDVGAYVEDLNSQSPISFRDDWGFNSFTMVGDRYVLVDVMVPSSLSMFLSSLTGNNNNVKQLWIKELSQCGDRWKRLVDLVVEADCRVILNLRPKGDDQTALITLRPNDFNK